jgi:hypothetical protein
MVDDKGCNPIRAYLGDCVLWGHYVNVLTDNGVKKSKIYVQKKLYILLKYIQSLNSIEPRINFRIRQYMFYNYCHQFLDKEIYAILWESDELLCVNFTKFPDFYMVELNKLESHISYIENLLTNEKENKE